jgi:two-component system, OmpR family, osmolarity sensor histidine kinase EnvZ
MLLGTDANLLARLQPRRLSGYAALLFLAVGVIQLVGSLLFYQAIDKQTLREDHARRIAEMLVVSDRVYRRDGRLTAEIMTSHHLEVSIAPRPSVSQQRDDEDLAGLARTIVAWEPTLANRPLRLAIARERGGRRNLVGSMQVADGAWLDFKSRDISTMWPIAWRAMVMTLLTFVACFAVGLIAIRRLTAPLRRMSDAAEAIGKGRRVAIREVGPADLRDLARAMNEMQDRIARLMEDQARSFEAISHDLRTPLQRQKLAADLIDDAEIREIVGASADEMEAMLRSLQQFLRAQHLAAEPEPIDLGAALRDLVAPFGERVRLASADEAVVVSYREPLLLALRALIENASRFGERVDVTIEHDGADWTVAITDDGPGIPAEHFEDVLAPFFRLDEARGRTTHGFGLGIPTAHLLLRRFGGGLSFEPSSGGGLTVRVRVPHAEAAEHGE